MSTAWELYLVALLPWLQSPLDAPFPIGQRHYLVQIKIIEVDEQGRQTVIASPSLQTLGAASGVAVDGKQGRRFEFHFGAVEPGTAASASVNRNDPNAPRLMAIPEPLKAERPLNQRVTVKAAQLPRKAVLKSVLDQAGLYLVLDPESLATLSPALGALITLELTDVPIEDALRQITEPAQLRFTVRQELLLLGADPALDVLAVPMTTPTGVSSVVPAIPPSTLPAAPGTPRPLPAASGNEPPKPIAAKTEFSVRVYPVQDLLEADAETGRPNFKPLIDRLRQAVLPETWDTRGGAATIRGFDSTQSLVVRHTAAGHEALAQALAALRKDR